MLFDSSIEICVVGIYLELHHLSFLLFITC